jgi:hypothetical protein
LRLRDALQGLSARLEWLIRASSSAIHRTAPLLVAQTTGRRPPGRPPPRATGRAGSGVAFSCRCRTHSPWCPKTLGRASGG